MSILCRLRPNRPQVLAGTVPCPECQGNPMIRRHTANLEKAFNLEEPWQFLVRPCVTRRCRFIIVVRVRVG